MHVKEIAVFPNFSANNPIAMVSLSARDDLMDDCIIVYDKFSQRYMVSTYVTLEQFKKHLESVTSDI